MDILSSGSFVTLDNRDKIEQLIFTAKTLATETGRNDGFQNSGQTHQQLGLEMWKGTEYMCRANEEATIKNLFLSNFLQRLSEIVRESATSKPATVEPPATPSVPETQTQEPEATGSNIDQVIPAASEDEFLGVVAQTEPIEEMPRTSYLDECKPECEDEIVEMTNGSAKEFVPPQPESASVTAAEPASETAPEVTPKEEASSATERSPQSVERESANPQVDSIVLAEKEPFNFEACTVTVVVQLLPVSEGFRKCVVSVRSHEFLPQISIEDLESEHINDEIKSSLEKAFARYRTELPALAADKMKQEAKSNKKRTNKQSESSKAAKTTTPTSTTGSATSNTSANPTVESSPNDSIAEPAKNQQTLFAQ
ncbi:MAG: hypothetical protein WBO10_12560 [Pyrinomonadaceae bacterium]